MDLLRSKPLKNMFFNPWNSHETVLNAAISSWFSNYQSIQSIYQVVSPLIFHEISLGIPISSPMIVLVARDPSLQWRQHSFLAKFLVPSWYVCFFGRICDGFIMALLWIDYGFVLWIMGELWVDYGLMMAIQWVYDNLLCGFDGLRVILPSGYLT